MLKDQRDLLLALNAHNVRYLVVGGYAYSYYAEPRATKDLDVFVDSSPENAVSVFEALADFGAPLSGMTPKDFQDGKSWFQVGVVLGRIDVIKKSMPSTSIVPGNPVNRDWPATTYRCATSR
jgi:hypothetical protein